MATPFMILDLPTPSVTLGPQWASDLNAALTLVDSHDHSSGKGAKVKPDGLNINADLDIQSNHLNDVSSVRLIPQAASPATALDIQSLYSLDGDLYYNNELGAPVRITNGNAIDIASVGAIGGDYATTNASIVYTNINETYTFDADADQRGSIDVASVTIREPLTASANGITLESPPALAAGYNITLPTALPGSTQLMTLSATGIVDYADTDESSLETTGAGVLQIKDLGVTEAKINTNAVTNQKIATAAVSNAKMATNAIAAVNLQSGSVSTPKIATAAVTGNKIANLTYSQAIVVNAQTVTVTVAATLTGAEFFFSGTSDCHIGATSGADATATYTLTGPSGVISSGNFFVAGFSDMLPSSALNQKFPTTTIPAGSYTMTLINARFEGGAAYVQGVAF